MYNPLVDHHHGMASLAFAQVDQHYLEGWSVYHSYIILGSQTTWYVSSINDAQQIWFDACCQLLVLMLRKALCQPIVLTQL